MINEMIRESAYPAMGCMALVSCKLLPGHGSTRAQIAQRARASPSITYHLSAVVCLPSVPHVIFRVLLAQKDQLGHVKHF
jgi:hypothetical protein